MTKMPEQGVPWPELKAQLEEAGSADADWRGGRVPMFIHYAGEDVLDVAKQAYQMYFSENGLGLRALAAWPASSRRWWPWGLACCTVATWRVAR